MRIQWWRVIAFLVTLLVVGLLVAALNSALRVEPQSLRLLIGGIAGFGTGILFAARWPLMDYD